ncbi:hypothetical protein EU537_10875 [Candidatus Thorarchaeota archaeon]|nr:MAG: hypothetical protein EU537_10875 [Candidatus Thorarchaeota archaeon]
MALDSRKQDTHGREFVYVIMYRLRAMSNDEKRDWLQKWASIRKQLPDDIRILTEAGNAFGTDFTGFTIFEGPFDKFQDLTDLLELHSGNLVEKTKTIIGTKGLVEPKSDLLDIIMHRPVD